MSFHRHDERPQSVRSCEVLLRLGGLMRVRLTAFLLTMLFMPVEEAAAQSRPLRTHVQLPGLTLNAPETAWAVDLNPAALGFLPAWHLAYVHSEDGSDQALAGRGDGFALALPLPFGVAFGMSGHSIRPAAASGALPRGVVSLALALASSEQFSIGTALRFISASDEGLDGTTSLDASVAMRPNRWLAVTLAGRDLTAPYLSPLDRTVPRSGLLAFAVRPTGRDDLTLELASGLDARGDALARAAANARLPYLGRALAAFDWSEVDGRADYVLTAGLAIDWQSLSAGGGVHLPRAGDGASSGWYVAAELSGAKRHGITPRKSAIEVELRDPGEREWIQWLETLEDIAQSDRYAAVVFKLRSGGLPMAYAQELREMIEVVQQRGKHVTCHLESAERNELYACSSADRVYADPAGVIRFEGVQGVTLMFGETLSRVGVRADFVRIGKYKSAPETFMRKALTKPAHMQRKVFLDDAITRLHQDLAKDWEIRPERVERMESLGPFTASEALAAELIDGVAGVEDLERELSLHVGSGLALESHLAHYRPRVWGAGAKVGVVLVDDTIVDGESNNVPVLGVHTSGSDTIVEALDYMAHDPAVGAVVLRVDSPGGSALASDRIWRAVRRLREQKPVVASLGAIAASGGYYVASAADEIWAPPTCLTGSIGVFFGKFDVAQLAERLGLGIEIFKRGRRAGAETVWRPFTEDERRALAHKVFDSYQRFLGRIATGRKMSVQRIHRLAQGRVWSADRAVRHGLVDHLGGYVAALRRARQLAGLPADAEVKLLPEVPGGLLEFVTGGSRTARSTSFPSSLLPSSLGSAANYLWALAESEPLALTPVQYQAP